MGLWFVSKRFKYKSLWMTTDDECQVMAIAKKTGVYMLTKQGKIQPSYIIGYASLHCFPSRMCTHCMFIRRRMIFLLSLPCVMML
jgi:hypothetical protein